MRIVEFFKKLFGRSKIETRSINSISDIEIKSLEPSEVNMILAGYLESMINNKRISSYVNIVKFINCHYSIEVGLEYDIVNLPTTEEFKSLAHKFGLLQYKFNDPKLSAYLSKYQLKL